LLLHSQQTIQHKYKYDLSKTLYQGCKSVNVNVKLIDKPTLFEEYTITYLHIEIYKLMMQLLFNNSSKLLLEFVRKILALVN
jgi:hypothetical protein